MSNDKNLINENLPAPVNKNIIELIKKRNEFIEEQERIEKELRNELWAAIHETYPLLDKEANYSIDSKYIDAGVVMLKNAKKR